MPPPGDVRRSETVTRVPRVASMMTPRYVQVEPGTPMGEVAQRLIARKSAWAAVVDDAGAYVGIVSTQGVLGALVERLLDEMPMGPASHYLDPGGPPLREDTPLLDAMEAFVGGGPPVHALPVLRDGKLVGVVTRLDAVRAAMKYFAKDSIGKDSIGKDSIGKDKGPGAATLYMSALRGNDEKPPY